MDVHSRPRPVISSGMRHSITAIVFSILSWFDYKQHKNRWYCTFWLLEYFCQTQPAVELKFKQLFSTLCNEDGYFTCSRTPTTTKFFSMLAIAICREPGWPNVLQAFEVPQNQGICDGENWPKAEISSKRRRHILDGEVVKHLGVSPVQSLVLRHRALEFNSAHFASKTQNIGRRYN